MNTMKGITVYLVRHGQTWFNHFNKMQGWCDSPLTDNGIKDGTKTGVILRNVAFTHAYCSDTMRATRTANLILSKNVTGKIPLTVTQYFREQFYGYFEGEDSSKTWYEVGFPHGAKTYPEILEKYGVDASKDFMHDADPFHEAEDARTYWTRLMKGFRQLRAENHEGDKVLMVSHGTTIRSIVDKFGKNDGYVVTDSPRNGSISKILLTDEGIKVLSYNEFEA